MKSTMALFALMLSLSVSASSITDLKVEGTYKAVRPFAAFNYNKADCKEDGGKFIDGACFFKDGGATVVISKNAQGELNLAIDSIGTNFHMCNYEGVATKLNAVQLTSNDRGNEYAGECELSVRFTSEDSLTVVSNGKCSEYCGANMSLDLEDAKRVK